VALSVTDQDIIASIQSQLDGLRQTADGEILYRLIERGLKRRDGDYDGDTGNAFVAFLHNILGRYAATPTGDTVTRVKVRLIQQRIAPHMMEDEGEPAPVAATPEPIDTPVEEIKTETPVSAPGPEEDSVVDPLQAALDQLLAEDAVQVSQAEADDAGSPSAEPPSEASPNETDTSTEPEDMAPAPEPESRPARYRRPPEEEVVPLADPDRPLFSALDDLEFPKDELITPDPVADTGSAGSAVEKQSSDAIGGAPEPTVGSGEAAAEEPVSAPHVEPVVESAKHGADDQAGDEPESAAPPSTSEQEAPRKPPAEAGSDRVVRDAKESGVVEQESPPQESAAPAAATTVPIEETPVSPADDVARKEAANNADEKVESKKRAKAAPGRGMDSGDKTPRSATTRTATRRTASKRKRVAKAKPKAAPKPSKPLELQDTWGPAAPETPPSFDADSDEPDIVVGEPAKPLFPPSPSPAQVIPATAASTASPPKLAPQPVKPSPAPVPAEPEDARQGSRQRVDKLHETFANKLAESISRSRDYHSMLRTTLKTLKLADKSRDFVDLKRLLQTGLEELLQSSESLGKDLGATSHYLRISQLDRDLLKDELTRVRDQSLVDDLTGLHNRAGFTRQLEAEIGRTKRYGFSLSVAVLHMEALAEIAAHHGSDAVDEVLRTYAKEILSHFRGYDWVARIADHRFGILFPNTQKEGAMTALDKAHKRASSMVIRHKATSIKIPPFTSVLTLYHPGDKPDALLQRADEAFALAKEQDRDRIIVALPGT
jgi:diguanylate cyclase (GGDEF)-like protein